MAGRKINKSVVIALLLIICSIGILIYQLNYSESVRIKRNLSDFSQSRNFSSSKVLADDIESIYRKNNDYSFTIASKETAKSFQKIGKILMLDKHGEVINQFVLFKDKEKYLVYMRGVYMIVD